MTYESAMAKNAVPFSRFCSKNAIASPILAGVYCTDECLTDKQDIVLEHEPDIIRKNCRSLGVI